MSQLKAIGLTKRNVNYKLCPGDTLKVRVPKGKPFVATISEPVPIVYAILCEQIDTVLFLIREFSPSLDVCLNGFFFNLSGFRFILQQQLEIIIYYSISCVSFHGRRNSIDNVAQMHQGHFTLL
jgi:protein involved in polysaccharide export with SLBB domain